MEHSRRQIAIQRLGRRGYAEVHALQRDLQARRYEDGIDRLLLVEHDPVLTLGRNNPEPKLRVAFPLLETMGIPVVQAERGGDITYHGPGQLVAYAIIDLRGWDIGPGDLVHGLETAAIETVANWKIRASRDRRNRGAWVGGRKLASIGIHVRRGVSMHGIALNVAPDMEHFGLIDACGMPDVEATSMERELGTAPALRDVENAFERAFIETFGCESLDTPDRAASAEGGSQGSP
jgi:lipoate-protein ligase B